MRLHLSESELEKIRRIVIGNLARRYRSADYLFSPNDYRDWIAGVTDMGLAEALASDDWTCEDGLDEKALLRRKIRYVILKARTVARADLRSERRQIRATETVRQGFEIVHDHAVDDWILSEEIRSSLGCLSADQQTAMTMVYLQGLPIETVAATLCRSRPSLDMILFRAKAKLRKHLQGGEAHNAPSASSRSTSVAHLGPQKGSLRVSGSQMPPEASSFGQLLLRLRTTSGCSTRKIAHRVGLATRTWKAWEGGISVPTPEQLALLASQLHWSEKKHALAMRLCQISHIPMTDNHHYQGAPL